MPRAATVGRQCTPNSEWMSVAQSVSISSGDLVQSIQLEYAPVRQWLYSASHQRITTLRPAFVGQMGEQPKTSVEKSAAYWAASIGLRECAHGIADAMLDPLM